MMMMMTIIIHTYILTCTGLYDLNDDDDDDDDDEVVGRRLVIQTNKQTHTLLLLLLSISLSIYQKMR